MSNYAYTDLLLPRNTASGIADKTYLAPVSWFATGGIKMPAAPYLSPGDQVRIYEKHEFLPGKGFVQVLMAPEKNSLEAKTVGTRETQKLAMSLNVFFPGSYAQLHETLMYMLNEPFIALHKDSNCSSQLWYQLGDPVDYVWMKGDWTSGTTADGVKGYTCSFGWTHQSMLEYFGDITLIGGDTILGDFDPADFVDADFLTP